MFLDLDDDEIALRDGIRSLLEGRFDSARIRAGFDRAMFDELAGAGVFSLRADGFSWADAAIVFEQLGEFCVPGPLVGSFLAGDGTIVGVVDAVGVVGAVGGGAAVVEHLEHLDTLMILGPDSLTRVAASTVAGELLDWPLDPLTPVWHVARLPQGDVVSGADPSAWRQAGAVLTAALCLGLAQRTVDAAVAYALERVQFDRPIGGFQAIKHLLADMAVRTEVARAAVYQAAAHLDAPDLAGLDRSVSVAKAQAGEAAIRNGKDATQVHGGMGYTWEVDVHLYLKRSWVLDTHFGSAEIHFDAVAATLGRGARSS